MIQWCRETAGHRIHATTRKRPLPPSARRSRPSPESGTPPRADPTARSTSTTTSASARRSTTCPSAISAKPSGSWPKASCSASILRERCSKPTPGRHPAHARRITPTIRLSSPLTRCAIASASSARPSAKACRSGASPDLSSRDPYPGPGSARVRNSCGSARNAARYRLEIACQRARLRSRQRPPRRVPPAPGSRAA